MKAWVFVEGRADELGLQELWSDWRQRLRESGRGIVVIPLDSKASFFKRFGPRAAEKLAANEQDVVVGLPDLFPTSQYDHTQYEHSDIGKLRELEVRLVFAALRNTQGLSDDEARRRVERFHASAFKHDFEMLLLAAKEELRAYLGTKDQLGGWRQPVEDQDFEKPPKRIVEDLFRTKHRMKHAYREATDAPAVLRRVKDLKKVLFTDSGQCTCPVFLSAIKWMGERLGIPCIAQSS